MRAAIVQTCVDYRLNHELLRIQVQHKLTSLRVSAQRIFILNEIGGNFSENFRNTVDLLLRSNNEIVVAAVLHHDDCLAEKQGLKRPMPETIAQVSDFLKKQNVNCALVSGNIHTVNNHIIWDDDRQSERRPIFGARIRNR